MASAMGLLPYLSPQEVEAQDQAKKDAATEVQDQAEQSVQDTLRLSLVQYIKPKWEDAKDAKLIVEQQMLKSVQQKRGEYDYLKLAEIQSVDQPVIFMNITETKCAAAEAQIKDIIVQPGKRIFSADPTPLPELPEDIERKIQEQVLKHYLDMAVQQIEQTGKTVSSDALKQLVTAQTDEIKAAVHKELLDKAKKMATAIEDRIDQDWILGGFYHALEEVVQDIVSLKAGFIKGPVFRKRKVKETKRDPQTGRLSKKIVEKIMPEYERRSPFSIFPSPRSNDIDDGYLFDVILLSPHQLHDLKGIDGFDEEAIDKVLEEFNSGMIKTDWLVLSDEAKEGLGEEDRRKMSDHYPYESIYCLEFWDEIPGSKLKEWDSEGKMGLRDAITDENDTYPACVWMINDNIIKAMLNYDEIGHKPFSYTSFQKENDSFWGHGVPEKIEDCQQVCNACARAIVANVGIASGPMIDMNIDRMEPGASRKIWPWRVFPTTDEQMGGGSKALNFYQPTMVTEKLIVVYSTFSKIADEHSGVPAFAHGDSQVGGAGNSLANYEKVLTPTGATEINNLKVGDLVANSYGSFSRITGVFPQGESDIFRVKFGNGTYVDCDMKHRWSVRTHQSRKFRTLTTEEIIKKGLFRKNKIGWRNPKEYRPKWMLPIVDYVEFGLREVKIDPYTMGALLGDGDHRGRITTMDKEIFDRIPYPLGKIDRLGRGKAWTRTVKGVRPAYRSYGLKCTSLDKFIPDDYLFNNKEVRLELLRGLMDTDGCCSKAGEVFFATSSLKLADDFVKLVRSLGAVVNKICEESGGDFEIKGRNCTRQKTYRVVFNLSHERIFHLERKQERVRVLPRTHTYIIGIEYIGKHEATCISVDSKDKLFICENFIPTHNTASGLFQLTQMAATGIRSVVRNIDIDIIIPCVEAHYDYILDNMEIIGLVGDFNLSAQGTTALMAKQQLAQRKTEFMQATANPTDIQLIGIENRRKMLFEVAKAIGIDLENSPVPVFSGQPNAGTVPGAKPAQLDESGQPIQGTDTRLANTPAAPRGPEPIPARAEGGPVEKGKPYVVGERGPEVVVPDNNGTVIPNKMSYEDYYKTVPAGKNDVSSMLRSIM